MPNFKTFKAAQKAAKKIHKDYGFKASVMQVTKPSGAKFFHVISPRSAGMKKLTKRKR